MQAKLLMRLESTNVRPNDAFNRNPVRASIVAIGWGGGSVNLVLLDVAKL